MNPNQPAPKGAVLSRFIVLVLPKQEERCSLLLRDWSVKVSMTSNFLIDTFSCMEMGVQGTCPYPGIIV